MCCRPDTPDRSRSKSSMTSSGNRIPIAPPSTPTGRSWRCTRPRSDGCRQWCLPPPTPRREVYPPPRAGAERIRLRRTLGGHQQWHRGGRHPRGSRVPTHRPAPLQTSAALEPGWRPGSAQRLGRRATASNRSSGGRIGLRDRRPHRCGVPRASAAGADPAQASRAGGSRSVGRGRPGRHVRLLLPHRGRRRRQLAVRLHAGRRRRARECATRGERDRPRRADPAVRPIRRGRFVLPFGAGPTNRSTARKLPHHSAWFATGQLPTRMEQYESA